MNVISTNFRELKCVTLSSLTTIFLLYVFLPSIFMGKIDPSSYTTGFLLFSVIVIVFSLINQKKTLVFYALPSILVVIISFILFVVGHSFFSFCLTGSYNIIRAIGSIIVLIILIFAAYFLTLSIKKTSDSCFVLSLNIISIVLIIISVLGIIGLKPFTYSEIFNKPIFPFVEPSHYALFIAPFYFSAICKQNSKIRKTFIVLLIVVFLIFINNLTIGCLFLIGLSLSVKLKRFLIIFFPLFIFVFSYTNMDITYYTDRLDVQNDNLSTLVWLQGWEEAVINFKNSFGLGVGFQQLGVLEPQGNAANSIYSIFGDYLNRYDGGTMGAKIISEFGIIGFIIIIFILLKVTKSFMFLTSNIKKSTKSIFYHCCIIGIIVELFIRSVGYIGPSFFMFLTGIIGVHLEYTSATKMLK